MTEPGSSMAWSISEAARRAGVSPGTIRTWEREGLITPRRSPGGVRRFDEAQMRRVERVAYLRKVHKLNTAGIRAALDQDRRPEDDEPDNGTEERSQPSYGDHLRRTRQSAGHTLARVAAETGLSTSFISALERGQVGAGVGTIQKLLRFYGTTENAMLNTARATGRHGTVTRRGVRGRVTDGFSKVTTEQLLPVQPALGASISTVEPGGGSRGSYSHEGDEFILVMAGTFQVHLADELYDLTEGDCLFFASSCPHSWQNVGSVATVVLWVTTPPTF